VKFRSPWAVFAWVLGALGGALPAQGQSCHRVPELESGDHAPDGHGLQVALAFEAASIEDGDYQGALSSVLWNRDWAGAAITLPVYRLRRGDETVVGLGDLVVQGHARLVGDARGGAGLTAGIGLPTGSAEDGLGMGHVMVLGGAFGVWQPRPFGFLLSVLLARSLGEHDADEHEHDADSGPSAGARVVDPMNFSEIGSMLRAAVAVTDELSVYALGLVAVPVFEPGVTRVQAGPGAQLSLGAWLLGAELQFGIAGDPFEVRALVSAGLGFDVP
jgi:hypothetical protein